MEDSDPAVFEASLLITVKFGVTLCLTVTVMFDDAALGHNLRAFLMMLPSLLFVYPTIEYQQLLRIIRCITTTVCSNLLVN